jgi:hypothetical protein
VTLISGCAAAHSAEWARSAGAALPGVGHRDADVGEVLGVAGGEGGRLGAADGGDLGVEAVNRLAEALTRDDDIGVR